MGQNIRTLTAHAQWHTTLRLHARSESDRCVLSYPLLIYMNVPTSHSCLFSSIIDAAQQLMARFTTAAISAGKCHDLDIEKIEGRRSICGHFHQAPQRKINIYIYKCLPMNLCSSLSFLFPYFFLFVFFLFLLFVSSRQPSPESFPCKSLGQTGVGIESRPWDRQAFFTHTHAHGHTHTCPLGLKCKLPHSLLSISHTLPLSRPLGRCR